MATTSNVLKKSLESAWLNMLAMLLFRAFTFIANAVMLRHVSGQRLGVLVRLYLYLDTVLFISTESFRRSCVKRPEDPKRWPKILNLVWLGLPIGIVLTTALSYVWKNVLELPTEHVEAYKSAVDLVTVVILLRIVSEPFFVIGQAFLKVKFRAFADLLYMCVISGGPAFVVAFSPEDKALTYTGYLWVANALVYLTLHVIYIGIIDNPFKNLADFKPNFSAGFDAERKALCLSFFGQGIVKHLLTEGEKLMFTTFSLMTLAEQGVYDAIANLGAIPARLFFCKMEESAHLYFSQSIKRGDKSDEKTEKDPSMHLHTLLKALTLFGLVVAAFGMSYSHLLLHLYGGLTLSAGSGPNLLRAQCFLVSFLAFNGISECYAFNAMTSEQLDGYNYRMTAMSGVFLGLSWMFSQVFGPIGFVLANMANFGMRIAHNVFVIGRRHTHWPRDRPLHGLLPSTWTLTALIASFFVCAASERIIYDSQDIRSGAIHVVVRALCFLGTLTTIAFKEEYVNVVLKRKLKRE